MSDDVAHVCEVGPRDGLQNESRTLSAAERVGFIQRLAAAGLRCIEAGAFVSPRAVPQMAGTAEVLAGLGDLPADVRLPVLVANQRGLDEALACGAREVALFTGATDTFTRHNIGCDIATSLARFAPLAGAARAAGVRLRGYVSVAFGCPYEGAVPVEGVLRVAAALADMGCAEVSIGDTIGMATPAGVDAVLGPLCAIIPPARLAGHFHDTRGMAVANVLCALGHGLRRFDASVGGLGGCPYAPGASGNVATEELVYLFEGQGLRTGIDLGLLMAAGEYVDGLLGRASYSRVRAATGSSRARPASRRSPAPS